MSSNPSGIKPTIASSNKQQPKGTTREQVLQNPQDHGAEAQLQALESLEKESSVQNSVSQVFSPNRDELAAIPYILDGDLSMYAPDKLAARQQLQQSPAVVGELDKLGALFRRGTDGHVSQASYAATVGQIAQVLLGQDIQEDELRQIVLADWDKDSKGKEYLDSADLREALFELVDTWTQGLGEPEYLLFMAELHGRLAALRNPPSLPR